jgi:PAS domain S-box-containing protein
MLERRHESRIRVQLSVVIFGVDGNGKRFTRTVPATNISRSGALLMDVDVQLRCGDYLAIQYNEQRANFRVVWLRPSHWEGHFRIAVHKIENQPCPWEEVLSDVDKRPQSMLETTTAKLDQALRENWGMEFSESSMATWVFDRKTLAFLAVNEAAINAYGYSREEFLTMTILDIRPKEDVRAVLGAALGPHPANGALESWRHRRKDGSVVDIVLSARPLILEGRPAELIAIHKMAEAGAAAVP